ncbi:MAG: hypothetical protein MJ067_06365, partial [Oscillospiraceae bacterium]|nr:hypothetical protein [Oscillospiraceae bacterium]
MPKDKIELDVNDENKQKLQFSWTDLTDDSKKIDDKDWEVAEDLFKRDQILNYDFAYIEKQKMAAKEKGEFIYKEAIATLTKPEPSPFRFFSWLKHKFAKREAEDRLYEIMAKKTALDEQQANLDERRENLQEKGKKIIEEKPNPQEEKKSVDADMDYKEWKGGRGFDVINPSQAMAKANDEKALSDFKNGVLEKAKADLQMQVKEYERSLNEVQLELDEELKSFTKGKLTDEIKARALRIRADEEERKARTEEYEASKKQFKADQKRLKELPKLMKKNEEELKKRSEEYKEE